MKVRAHDLTPGPSIEWRTAMDDYIGLDVSMKETAVSIRRDGKRVWRGKCPSDPKLIADLIRKRAPSVKRVIFETGPLSVWFYHALCAEGLPAICIDARHAKAARDMAANKTDANDADGLAHLAEVGFYREVRVKGFDSMLTRTLVAARTRLVRICTELSNQIRGLMKTFGHISRRGDRQVRGLLFEAATVILTRSSADSGLRTWGLKLRERVGFKRAAVAVARKLAVLMHAMLKTGTFFDRSVGAAA